MITNNEFLLLRYIYFMKSFPWLFRTESFDTSGKGYSYFYLLIVINTCSLHWVTEFVCAFHFKSSSEKKYNYVCEPFFSNCIYIHKFIILNQLSIVYNPYTMYILRVYQYIVYLLYMYICYKNDKHDIHVPSHI